MVDGGDGLVELAGEATLVNLASLLRRTVGWNAAQISQRQRRHAVCRGTRCRTGACPLEEASLHRTCKHETLAFAEHRECLNVGALRHRGRRRTEGTAKRTEQAGRDNRRSRLNSDTRQSLAPVEEISFLAPSSGYYIRWPLKRLIQTFSTCWEARRYLLAHSYGMLFA
ncbi:UNVERIFIED_CONTAM: hypothetical protein FKN15_073269 [Acipenser sinensis]